MKADVERVIGTIAVRVARRYAARCWWASEADLQHEAVIATLEARRTWEPGVGVPFAAYAWQAAIYHLKHYLWRNSAPASGSESALRGVHRAPLKEAMRAPVDVPPADELLDEARWLAQLQDQVGFLLRLLGPIESKVAARVLLDEEKPAMVAADSHLEVVRVYRIVARARQLLATNAMLYDLHKERTAPS